jgi:hypothetical protein
LFWYRQRKLLVADNELAEEIAGFPHVDFDEARLFSCGVSWAPPKTRERRRALEGVDLHDRGGRARFSTPDGRELLLELHGRDWPLSEGRESLVLRLELDFVGCRARGTGPGLAGHRLRASGVRNRRATLLRIIRRGRPRHPG